MGTLALALAAMLMSRFHAPKLCWDVAWTSAACGALAGTLLARARADAGHRAWTLWAVAAAAWLCGQLAWDVYGIVGFPQSPNFADALWWGFALLAMAAILRTPGASRSARMRAIFETLALIVAAVAVTLAELWENAADSQLSTAPKVSGSTAGAIRPS